MPNPIAFLVLALWPMVTAALLARLPVERAMILSILLGYLFLPEPPAVFDLPAMPPFSKHNIPALTIFVICLWRYGVQGSILPQSAVGKVLLFAFIFSPVLTVVNNAEPVFFGQVGLPGLGPRDMVALTVQQFLLVLPFLLARQFLASGGAQRELLIAFTITGLIYSLLMLIEMRLSPQLNLWVYGYYQHLFGQSIRFGGYRPVVFLYHGIWVAFFAMTALVSAWALWRNDDGAHRNKYLGAGLYMIAILVLAKSLGALIFAALLLPCVILLGRVMQIKVAIVIGLLAISYPILKGADLIPEDRLLSQAAAIDPDRAASLQFRFEQERILKERAAEKPIFGWGSWGRNHILDPVSGNILTITDGRWIIVIGVYGWVGFLAEFGLLILPLFLLWREATLAREDAVSPFIAPLSLLLAINVFDMLPNATLTPLTWLLAGALMGYAEKLRAARLELQNHVSTLKWQSIM